MADMIPQPWRNIGRDKQQQLLGQRVIASGDKGAYDNARSNYEGSLAVQRDLAADLWGTNLPLGLGGPKTIDLSNPESVVAETASMADRIEGELAYAEADRKLRQMALPGGNPDGLLNSGGNIFDQFDPTKHLPNTDLATYQAQRDMDNVLVKAAEDRAQTLGNFIDATHQTDADKTAMFAAAKASNESADRLSAMAHELERNNVQDSIFVVDRSGYYSIVDDRMDPAPLQGYDVQIWVERMDATWYSQRDKPLMHAIDNMILFGEFQEIQLKILSRTLPYHEADSRGAILLDEDFQFFFTMNKGLLDLEILEQTFGLRYLHRLARFNRLPRIRVTFTADPCSLDPNGYARSELNEGTYLQFPVITGRDAQGRASANTGGQTLLQGSSGENARAWDNTDHKTNIRRYPIGRWVLEGAKCQELLLHAGPAAQIVKNQYTGQAEALRAVVFKQNYQTGHMELEYLHKGQDNLDFKHFASGSDFAAAAREPLIEEMIRKRVQAEMLTAGMQTASTAIQESANAFFGS